MLRLVRLCIALIIVSNNDKTLVSHRCPIIGILFEVFKLNHAELYLLEPTPLMWRGRGGGGRQGGTTCTLMGQGLYGRTGEERAESDIPKMVETERNW